MRYASKRKQQAMTDWWNNGRWLRWHATVAPFGILATTVFLTYLVQQGQRDELGNITVATDVVDLAAVLYAVVAVLVERGINMIWWALEQRQKRIAERERQESEQVAERERQESERIAALWVKILVTARSEGLITTDQGAEAWKRLFAQNGVALDDLPAQSQTA